MATFNSDAHQPIEILMMPFFRYLFWMLARVLLTLRYSIRVEGNKSLRGLRGPVLVLTNHPGYIDPMIAYTLLWPIQERQEELEIGLDEVPVALVQFRRRSSAHPWMFHDL